MDINNNFLSDDWGKVHHAYVISGADSEDIWQKLHDFLGFSKLANPDAYELKVDTFGIEEARGLSEWALLKSFSGDKKVAVIESQSFTVEAQNALLKLFEEPPFGTHFFILVPNADLLLPTLISRVRTAVFCLKENSNFEPNDFFGSSIAERLKMVSSIIKNKDKERGRAFVKFLEIAVHISMMDQSQKYALAQRILKAEKYVGVRGASLKLILENLAISLPNVKL